MENHEATRKDRIVLGFICLPVGVFFLFSSFLLIHRFVVIGRFHYAIAAIAAFCMIIGSGILYFFYLIASGRSETHKLGNGVLYLSSISFILLAAVCAVGILVSDKLTWDIRLRGSQGVGMFLVLGAAGFALARHRARKDRPPSESGES